MNYKKYIIIIVLVLVVAGVLFLVFRKKTFPPQDNVLTPVEQATLKIEEEKKNGEVMKSLDIALDKAREVDSDLDGLSDEEEKKLGTSLNNPDTDNDGLLDGDEVKSYRTSPLKADSDGDSFPDGYEVRRGYSPSGSGKLIK